MALSINQIEALEVNSSNYRVAYDEIVGDMQYKKSFVQQDSQTTAILTREKAYKVADILVNKVSNAKNVKVQIKKIGQYGADEYVTVLEGATLDVSGYTEVQ